MVNAPQITKQTMNRNISPKPGLNLFVAILAGALAVSTVEAAQVVVNAAPSVRTVDSRHFALNAAIWDSRFDEPANIALLRDLGVTAFRFPGGSISDEYHWALNRTGTNTFSWANSFTDFSKVVTNLGAQAIITVNYGSGTPEEAAAWVRHANVTNLYGFKYWEIGNECYGTWETDTNNLPHHAFTYATRAAAYFAQMKAVDPTIKIGVPVESSETAYANGYSDHPVVNPRTGATRYGWTPVMLATLASLGVTPDFLIFHRYPQGPGSESDAGLLQSGSSLATHAATLRQMLADYLGAAGANVELLCTELNSVYGSPGKQTTSLVNALFLADSLGSALKTEFNSVVWWDLRNGTSAGNNNSPSLYGWRLYGDYGIVNGYERYPTSYALQLLQYFARMGDALAAATSNDSLLSTYAVRRTNGALTLLVINKDPANSRTGQFTLQNFAARGDVAIRSYGIPQDEAARTGLGSSNIVGTALTGIGLSFTSSFAPYSVSVLTLQPNTTPSVPPTVTMTAPQNNAALATDQLTLAAVANDADGLVMRVEFVANGQIIATATNEPFTLTWSNVVPGSYTLRARATDYLGLVTTSTPVVISVSTAPITLIPKGATWRFLDTGADLGTAWRGPGFVDTAWPAGPAQLGFGDGDEATLIASNRQWTTYFRRTFVVPPNQIATNLLLRVLRDDGAAVYLNSNEVWRSNLPATGAIAYNTPALASVPAGDETTNFYTTNVSVTLWGTNVLAVEVHQNQTSSSDLSFDCELLAFVTTPPTLRIWQDSGTVALGWPAWATGAVAESSVNLVGSWTSVTNAVAVVNLERRLAINIPTNSPRFFRLRFPAR